MVVWIYCWQIGDRDAGIRQQPNVALNHCKEQASLVKRTRIKKAQLQIDSIGTSLSYPPAFRRYQRHGLEAYGFTTLVPPT